MAVNCCNKIIIINFNPKYKLYRMIFFVSIGCRANDSLWFSAMDNFSENKSKHQAISAHGRQ